MADIPAGTGLGSSGTFAVGLIRALHAMRRRHVTAEEVAREACHIEINLLRQAVGKQDRIHCLVRGHHLFRVPARRHGQSLAA